MTRNNSTGQLGVPDPGFEAAAALRPEFTGARGRRAQSSTSLSAAHAVRTLHALPQAARGIRPTVMRIDEKDGWRRTNLCEPAPYNTRTASALP